MRNVFEQYEHLENRITHALVTSLNEDPRLLRSFVKDIARLRPPARKTLYVEAQRIPGNPEPSEQEAEGRGLPDAWIHDGESWALLIESKITAAVRGAQLRRHLATAAQRGFRNTRLLVISAVPYERPMPQGAQSITWKRIYSWLRKHDARAIWAAKDAEYFEVLEARMVEQEIPFEGALTEFTGFPFSPDHPYGWPIFEGPSQPDAYLETPEVLIVIEGKRTEPGPTTTTTWMATRHQMLRHIDAAWELRSGRSVYGFFLVEGEGAAEAIAVPALWEDAARAAVGANALAESLPHRAVEERRAIADAFLRATTWQAVCREFGIPWNALPDRVEAGSSLDQG